jgi:hypothetical protein
MCLHLANLKGEQTIRQNNKAYIAETPMSNAFRVRVLAISKCPILGKVRMSYFAVVSAWLFGRAATALMYTRVWAFGFLGAAVRA